MPSSKSRFLHSYGLRGGDKLIFISFAQVITNNTYTPNRLYWYIHAKTNFWWVPEWTKNLVIQGTHKDWKYREYHLIYHLRLNNISINLSYVHMNGRWKRSNDVDEEKLNSSLISYYIERSFLSFSSVFHSLYFIGLTVSMVFSHTTLITVYHDNKHPPTNKT